MWGKLSLSTATPGGGSNLESAVSTAMCEHLGMDKLRTTSLHPQSDVLIEQFNRTLANHTTEQQCDWDVHFPLVLLAYRSVVQDPTSYRKELRAPAEMAFGNSLDTPIVWGLLGSIIPQESPGQDGVGSHFCP